MNLIEFKKIKEGTPLLVCVCNYVVAIVEKENDNLRNDSKIFFYQYEEDAFALLDNLKIASQNDIKEYYFDKYESLRIERDYFLSLLK